MAALTAPTRRRAVRTRRVAMRASGWATVVLVAVVWQLVSVAMKSPVFPTFTQSLSAAWDIVTGPELAGDVVPSIERALLGFAISAVLGVTVGLTLGSVRWLGDLCATVMDFLRSVPAPLFVPLGIVIFGLGAKMVIAIVVSAAVWPVLLNAFDAARRVDPVQLDTATALGIRRVLRFRRVMLPATLPSIIGGLRVALSTSLAVLVVAEILGAQSGIGYVIQDAQQTFFIAKTYGGVLILAALGWLFDTAFLLVERRVLRWERAYSGGGHA